MNIRIFTATPDTHVLTVDDVDRISFVNGESFGPGSKIGDLTTEGLEDLREDEAALVVNVNNFIAMEVSP